MDTTPTNGGSEQLFPATGVAFVVALAATWLVLAMARRFPQLLDRPNRRSSHIRPTPTLGGVGIVVGTWAGFASLLSWEPFQRSFEPLLWPLSASTGVLLLSALDELKQLKVLQKLALQVGAATIIVGTGLRLNGFVLPWVGFELSPAIITILTIAWIVFFTNVFNFMDGIDGISVTQTGSAGAWLALILFGLGSLLWLAPAVLVAAALGFAVFNFPPARIFMGDVGSHFLGFTFAVLSIVAHNAGLPLWLFAAIFGCYLFDSVYTIVRRLSRGENILEAHRSHLYQRLVQKKLWSHGQVCVAIQLMTLLLGAAVYTAINTSSALSAALFAAAALLLIACAVWLSDRDPKLE